LCEVNLEVGQWISEKGLILLTFDVYLRYVLVLFHWCDASRCFSRRRPHKTHVYWLNWEQRLLGIGRHYYSCSFHLGMFTVWLLFMVSMLEKTRKTRKNYELLSCALWLFRGTYNLLFLGTFTKRTI